MGTLGEPVVGSMETFSKEGEGRTTRVGQVGPYVRLRDPVADHGDSSTQRDSLTGLSRPWPTAGPTDSGPVRPRTKDPFLSH